MYIMLTFMITESVDIRFAICYALAPLRRRIDVLFRKLEGVLRRGDTEAIGQGLQLAVAALFAEHAEMISFHKHHINDIAAMLQ